MAFIVFEGIDGSGKTTQSKLLAERLEKEGMPTRWIRFPNLDTPYGKLIDSHLRRQWRVLFERFDGIPDEGVKAADAMVFQALQIVNRIECMADLIQATSVSFPLVNIVSDRYWQSGYAYGGADGLDKDMLVSLHQFFPKPHWNILIDIDPATAYERIAARGQGERYDDRSFLERVHANYRDLWAKNADGYGHWIVLDGRKAATKEEMAEQVWAALRGLGF